MTLSTQAKQITQTFLSAQTNQVQQDVKQAIAELIASDVTDNALQTGDLAIEFNLPNATGGQTSLSSLLKKGPVVLSFYRGGWCPYCNLEFKALHDILPKIKGLGASLIGISPETPDNTLTTVEKHQLQFEVLSDLGNKLANVYGLIMTVPLKLRPYYQQWGFDIPALNGDESYQLPIPATYIINSAGKITACFVNKDYTQRMEPEDIIAALKILN